MLVGDPVQRLKTSFFSCSWSIAKVSASAMSVTCMKSRVCSPSPSMVKVSLFTVFRKNSVMTPLYGLFSFFGP